MFENRIPPPIVAAFFGLVMWASSLVLPALEVSDQLRIIVSISVLLLGVIFCAAGVLSFRLAKTTVNPLQPDKASSLVDSGIYRITRNPMYLGFSLFLLAWSVFLSSPLLILGMVAFVLFMNRFQIKPEERALTKIFGEEFEGYQARVSRWL